MIECFKVTKIYGGSIYSHGKYMLLYSTNSIVQALEGTLGIFCFRTIRDVYDFEYLHGLKPHQTRVYKIFGEESDLIHIPKNLICPSQTEKVLDGFYARYPNVQKDSFAGIDIEYMLEHYQMMMAPIGTINFKKIVVGKEILEHRRTRDYD